MTTAGCLEGVASEGLNTKARSGSGEDDNPAVGTCTASGAARAWLVDHTRHAVNTARSFINVSAYLGRFNLHLRHQLLHLVHHGLHGFAFGQIHTRLLQLRHGVVIATAA